MKKFTFPYVNQMDDPAKGFPKGMITLAIMVAVCAILGTVSLGMMFNSNRVPEDFLTNGAYYATAKDLVDIIMLVIYL